MLPGTPFLVIPGSFSGVLTSVGSPPRPPRNSQRSLRLGLLICEIRTLPSAAILGLTAERSVAPPSRRLSWRRPAATREGEASSRQPARPALGEVERMPALRGCHLCQSVGSGQFLNFLCDLRGSSPRAPRLRVPPLLLTVIRRAIRLRPVVIPAILVLVRQFKIGFRQADVSQE